MPIVLACITGLLIVSALSLILVRHRAATPVVYGACLTISLMLCAVSLLSIGQASSEVVLPLGAPLARSRISGSIRSHRPFLASSISVRRARPLCTGLRTARGGARPRAAVLSRLSRGDKSRGRRRRCLQLPVRLGAHVVGVVGAGDGAPSRSKDGLCGIRLPDHGELRHVRAAVRLRPARGSARRLCLRRHSRAPLSPGLAGLVLVLAVVGAGSRRAWRHCTSGCRSRTRPHRAMFRR